MRGEPSAQFAPPPVFLNAAILLYEALQQSSELTRALRLKQLPSIGAELHALAERRTATRLPNWRDLLPPAVGLTLSEPFHTGRGHRHDVLDSAAVVEGPLAPAD